MEREALKLALEALDSFGIDDYGSYVVGRKETDKVDNAIIAIKEALAQPTQEPVAHVYLFDHDGRPRVAWDNAKGIKIKDKLYTKPPKREWIGLTDEERVAVLIDKDGKVLDYENCAEAIEAKLKKKNS
jgi:hypothetical protein